MLDDIDVVDEIRIVVASLFRFRYRRGSLQSYPAFFQHLSNRPTSLNDRHLARLS